MKLRKILTVILIILLVILGVVAYWKYGKSDDQNNDTNPDTEVTQEEFEVVEEKVEAHAEIIEKEDASYEEWLAAAMVIAMTLTGEEHQIENIYYSSETDLANKADSDGVYLVYTSEGTTKCIHSKYLEETRSEKGKIDLSTKDLGFATFDAVEKSSFDVNDMKELSVDDLTTLISQSMLVSLYEN